MKIDLTVNRS